MEKEKMTINNIRDAVKIAQPEIDITDYSKLPTEGIVDIAKQIENFEKNKLGETAEILANLTPKEIEEFIGRNRNNSKKSSNTKYSKFSSKTLETNSESPKKTKKQKKLPNLQDWICLILQVLLLF